MKTGSYANHPRIYRTTNPNIASSRKKAMKMLSEKPSFTAKKIAKHTKTSVKNYSRTTDLRPRYLGQQTLTADTNTVKNDLIKKILESQTNRIKITSTAFSYKTWKEDLLP